MNWIIGVHGRKQSGKDTLVDGVRSRLGEGCEAKGERTLLIKKVCFADPLKKMCGNLFGISDKCLYGTEEEKNQEIEIFWSDMISLVSMRHFSPGVRLLNLTDTIVTFLSNHNIINDKPEIKKSKVFKGFHDPAIRLKTGKKLPADPHDWKMTSREFMQFFGTDVMRLLCPDAWLNGYKSQIAKIVANGRDNVVFTPDVRFLNEVETIAQLKTTYDNSIGILIKLLRDPSDGSDTHASEISLDNTLFDLVIKDMSKDATLGTCYKFLQEKGVFP